MMTISPTCVLFLLTAGSVLAQTTDPQDSIAELERMMTVQVQTAALRKQSIQDAPATVTIITAEEIRRYGHRTLGEALSNVRGFYFVSDGAFHYAGVRGFSLLGDYNMRFLVLLNGHQLTDNVYSAMYYFGQDFPVDMDLVEQIEIVRGPSSALYGSNGLFATVNVITKRPANASAQRLSMMAGSFGSQKINASSSVSLGRDSRLLLSLSGVHSAGRTLSFPELQQAGYTPFRTEHAEAEAGYQTYAAFSWKNWALTAVFGQHKAIAPTGWYGAAIGDTGTTDLESRDFVDASWSKAVGNSGELRWRTYYDRYRYDGAFAYDPGNRRNSDGALGDWIGSQLVYQRRVEKLGILTVGVEGNLDLRNLQYNLDTFNSPGAVTTTENFRIDHRRKSGGLFVQDEIKLGHGLTAYLGGRIDGTTSDPAFFSPHAALLYTRHNATYKLIYGRAFRNPSTYERYWEPNPALKAEHMATVEFVREQRINKRLSLVTSVYRYGLTNLIAGVPVREDTLQYRNTWWANSLGVEAEVDGRPADWLELGTSFSAQRNRAPGPGERLQNSPSRLAQFRASVPLWRKHLVVSGVGRYVGSRLSAYDENIPGTVLADLTVTAQHLTREIDLQFGLRNLFNQSYSDPLSPEHTPHFLPGARRNAFVKLIWRSE